MPTLRIEQEHWALGRPRVAGVDEAGRGAWAGPVAAGAVVLPADPTVAHLLNGVRDSKDLTSVEREVFDILIRRHALHVGVGLASAARVDRDGLLPATACAMNRALAALGAPFDELLVDGLPLKALGRPHTALVRGDARCLSIAAASVVAKVARDRAMVLLDTEHPGYNFAGHKGYGTAVHHAALCRLGPCPQHRRSYAPVARVIAQSFD